MKTEVYVTAPCLFMRWNQLRRIISGRFYRLIKRDVHPKIFFDGEYWSVFFDTLTDDEADILLCSAAMPDSPKANLYAQNKAKEFLPETVMAVIKNDIPFNFTRYMATADGIIFFGKNSTIKTRRDKKE